MRPRARCRSLLAQDPGRRQGTDPRAQGANFLLLPWPRRVRESDFRPVEGSVRSLVKEPFGFLEFVPS
jgi:hypothetical protein